MGVASFRWCDTQRYKDCIVVACLILMSAGGVRHVQAEMAETVLRMALLSSDDFHAELA